MKSKNNSAASSLRSHLLIGLIIVFVLVGGLGGWASSASISGAVIAQGNIIVESRSKRVQHKEGGIVGAIYVNEGQRVAASDLLLSLDDTLTKAGLSIVSKQLDELTARNARLIAERDGATEIRFDASLIDRASNEEIAQAMRGEHTLFEARRDAAQSQKDQLAEQIGQLAEEIKGLAAQRNAKASEMAFIADELSSLEGLFKNGHVTKTRMLALRREASRLKGEHGQFTAEIARAKGRISETKLQITQIDRTMLEEVVRELRETEAKMIELVERKYAAEDLSKRVEIRAPKSGFVHELAVHTVGGVIAPGETIMLIVPEEDQLVIEAQFNPTDIDQIRQGQTVVIRLPAFNQRTTPQMEGTISTISADLSQDQNT
ncbi:MAG: HlyD family type I secretion periplasmic adaptor subunit, partial [Hyphomicrobiales bacterium]|nr:HlyD family type I secretion periplasmic adaptor subunit [Hyphomicrobiales bacterium]